MSRSYKHRKSTLVHVKEPNSMFHKRRAVAAVRRAADVPDGKQYRKFYCSWNISDYGWTEKKYTREEFRRSWYDTAHFHNDGWGHDRFARYRTEFRNWKEAYRAYLKYGRSK